MGHLTRFSNWKLTASICALALVGLLPGSVAAATHPITFSVYVGEKCVYGTASDNAIVHFVWKDADGTRKARTDVVASSSGDWTFCSTRSWVLTEIGDTMTASEGSSSHQFTVPELTLFQNRISDVYKGRGPAGEYVRLVCGLSNGFEPCSQTWQIKVNSDGQWGYKPHWNVRGNETMFVTYKNDSGDRTWVTNVSPYVTVTIGQAAVDGSARVGSPVTIVLHRANTADVRGTAHATGGVMYGLFSSRFLNDANNKVKVHVGDRVTSDIADDLDWIVTDVQASSNASTDRINGHCDQGLDYSVTQFRGGTEIDALRRWTDEDGDFHTNYFNLHSGDELLVGCQLLTGDWIQKWFNVA